MRAIRRGLRFGAHDLPLMGCGDWNDGMNLVGRDGRGESVWLAWFLYENLVSFAGLAREREDQDVAELYSGEAARLRANIETHAWEAPGIGAPGSMTGLRSDRPSTMSARSTRSARVGRSSPAAEIPCVPARRWRRWTIVSCGAMRN